jgi:hypothetical protein
MNYIVTKTGCLPNAWRVQHVLGGRGYFFKTEKEARSFAKALNWSLEHE